MGPLTIGFLCMLLTTVWFYVKSLSAAQEAKKFYYVSLSVTGIATVAYLCMRANIGINYVECAGHQCEGGPYKALQSHGGMSYPLFWMRYVDWFFTTPFFLLDLCILADACPWETFFCDAPQRNLHRVRRHWCVEAQRERAYICAGHGHICR